MRAEAEWTMSGHLPSMEEYMEVTVPSFGLGPIALTSLYLVGPELRCFGASPPAPAS